jgi:hypothetical protein
MLSKINKCDSSRRKSKFGKFSLDKGHFITEKGKPNGKHLAAF